MTEYSRQIYGLGGYAYLSDDDKDEDDGDDPEMTPSYWLRKRHYR